MEKIGGINPAVSQLVNQASTEIQEKGTTGAQMHSGNAQIVEQLSPDLAARIQALAPADRAQFDAAITKRLENFFQGIGAIGELPETGSAKRAYVNWNQVDFANAVVGMPNPKKALRITIDMPAGFTGPDPLVYSERFFDKDPAGKCLPKTLHIGEKDIDVQVRLGDPILDTWSGAEFKGNGFVVWNEVDNMPIPFPADGKAAQFLVNGVDPEKLEKMASIFGGRHPGDLSVQEMRDALTRVVNEVSKDVYKAEFPQYADNNFDPIDVTHPGIGLHSKKGAVWAVRFDGPLDFNSPYSGTSTQSYTEGAVLIRTSVKMDDGTYQDQVRSIAFDAFDADDYKTPDGKPVTAASLPKAIILDAAQV